MSVPPIDTIRNILIAVLDQIDIQTVENISMDNTPSWDSMRHLSIITGLENEFDIFIDVDDAEKLTSYEKIVEYIVTHPDLS